MVQERAAADMEPDRPLGLLDRLEAMQKARANRKRKPKPPLDVDNVW